MLIQEASIDVAWWTADSEYAVFPQGARPKGVMIAPDSGADPAVVGGERYMFKRSRDGFPDQFWCEVVAYRIGCLLSVQVPVALAAWNSATGQCGALIQWFYKSGAERLVHAGDFLQQINPAFERKRGTSHSMPDNEILLHRMVHGSVLIGDWRRWWVDALAFDALIGNTDRHQDNWGFIFPQAMPSLNKCWLTPLFDNGTSLGYELIPSIASGWTEERVTKYIARGTHHLRWKQDDGVVERGHRTLLERALARWPSTRQELALRVANVQAADIHRTLSDLPRLALPVSMTPERLGLTERLLARRLAYLKELL